MLRRRHRARLYSKLVPIKRKPLPPRRSPLRRKTPLRARTALARRARLARPAVLVELRCAYCKAVFHRWLRRGPRIGERFFCCRRCARLYRQECHEPAPPAPTHSSEWWRNLRIAVRARDHFRCVLCGASERDLAHELDVDHIYPRRAFQSAIEVFQEFGLAGFVSTCPTCHGRKTSGPEREWLRGDALRLQQYVQTVTSRLEEQLGQD